MRAILAIDQGTTNSKAILVSEDGAILSRGLARKRSCCARTCSGDPVGPIGPKVGLGKSGTIGRAAGVVVLHQHAAGLVELERQNTTKPWTYVKGAPRNRRFLTDTSYELTGPAAGSALVSTAADPAGRTIKGTLGDENYNRAGRLLAGQGYLCVTLDLPCHGEDKKAGEPGELKGWTICPSFGETRTNAWKIKNGGLDRKSTRLNSSH